MASLLFVVWRMASEMISLSGGFIEPAYLFDLGKASVSCSPQDVSSAQGKSLQRLIPRQITCKALPGEGLKADSISYERREVP